jgi:hypothetical protein
MADATLRFMMAVALRPRDGRNADRQAKVSGLLGFGVDAANAIKVKHCELIDFSALQGSTLKHENFKKINPNLRYKSGLD